MSNDNQDYVAFTNRSRLDKSINSLLGIIEGIAIDARISNKEMSYLTAWLDGHEDFKECHPYNELFPIIAQAIFDGALTKDERLDIRWLCERLKSEEYYDKTTTDIQRLHAIMGAIAADGIVTESELDGLSDWLLEHEALKTCWPYDEVDGLITSVMKDRKIDAEEHSKLLSFFAEFVDIGDKRVLNQIPKMGELSIQGICAPNPAIIFVNSVFCFTGASTKYTREQFREITTSRGGRVIDSVSPKLNYLVIGAAGNPCWAYACYGRKVEQAVKLRKQGCRLLLVHEIDYCDAIS
jgi:hypothetical protein